MSSIDTTSIALDEVESTIRRLLLDVVDFIEKNPVSNVQDSAASKVFISEELRKEPLQLRWTGGWVRDKLLGVDSKDIDIAINKMTGYQFGLRMKEYLDKDEVADKYTIPGSKGAINAKLHKIEANPDKSKNLETTTTRILDLDLDLVNLRKETYTKDSRNPTVEFGTPEEDASRRDATINAMFYNIHTSSVEDFTGQGRSDLKKGIIRTPLEPHTTFIDDPLRVLRLIRFATRYNYEIEASTLAAMADDEIKQAFLAKITRERVWQELDKMLKGPGPGEALDYINRLSLYDAVFMDPGHSVDYHPDISNWSHCYNTIAAILSDENGQALSMLRQTVLSGPEEAAQAWVLSSLVPWVDAPDAPALKSGRPAPPMATIVARDGLKTPTKLCDLVTNGVNNMSAIREVISSRVKARDDLGMKIRHWGSTWRLQVLFSLLHEIYTLPAESQRLINEYASFLKVCQDEDLLEAYALKPLINGTELCAALGLKPGTWTKSALDVVMTWQLRNPQISDNEAALQEVRNWKESANIEQEQRPPSKKPKKKQGELTSVLTSHFLRLTLRPLFSQTPSNPKLTANARRNVTASTSSQRDISHVFNDEIRPWKRDQAWALDMLDWVCRNLDSTCAEREWGVLIPPVLTVLDDTEVHIKIRGCVMMQNLLQRVAPAMLKRTGLGSVFEESLMACTTYLPTLMPEKASIQILEAAYPSLAALGEALHPLSQQAGISPERGKYFGTVLRKGVLAGYQHAGENVRIAKTLIRQMPELLKHMGIASVVHLKETIPLLCNLLSDPFATASPELDSVTLKALKSVIENGWPRIASRRVDILSGICKLWLHLDEESPTKAVLDLQSQIQDIAIGLTSTVLAGDVSRAEWLNELRQLIAADEGLETLFADILERE